MEFVDYKCLESLLIDGENLIATEGIGEVIKNAFKRVVETLKTIKNKIIEIFSKFVSKIKANTVDVGKEIDAGNKLAREQSLAFKNIISNLSQSVGVLSKAVGNARVVDDTSDDSVQSLLKEFDRYLERANKYYDEAFEKQGWKINAKPLINELESVKNTFVQEIDLAIKIYSSANYNMANSYSRMSSGLANQLCSANSKFLTIYSKTLSLLSNHL